MGNDIIAIILTSSAVAGAITFVLSWLKDYFDGKKEEEKRINRIREETYKEVMANIDFIYGGNELVESEDKKNKFLKNYRMMFLYSSDEIIREVNNILRIVTNNSVEDTEEMKRKKDEIGKAMIVMRKDINKNTQITKSDFKHIK